MDGRVCDTHRSGTLASGMVCCQWIGRGSEPLARCDRSWEGSGGQGSMIRVRDLRVDYDTICAVRDLSLEVGPGEVCGLIGPNGAGKTTTMLAMLGLIEPTYGEIELAGVDMREHPRDASRLVAFMPDFPPMYDDLMSWEFLDLFAARYGI